MKPNHLQQQRLQHYLRSNLKYRETYAEFYDHILAALETKPADVNFEDATGRIIADDFGGIQGMAIIEDNYKTSIFTEMRKKYVKYTIENLTTAWACIVFAYTVLIYYMVIQPWFNVFVFMGLLLLARLVPVVLLMITRVNTVVMDGAPRRSIKSQFFRWQNIIPSIIIVIMITATPGGLNSAMAAQYIPPVFMMVLLMLMSFHSLTFYKVYRDDIKTSFSVR